MFDSELKRIYDDIQYDLKRKSEKSLEEIEQEISSVRNRIITKLDTILSFNRIQFDRYKLESIVDEYLVDGLKNLNKKVLVNNFQKLATFNDSIRNAILEQGKKQIEKEIKEKTMATFLQKFDYTMSEYKKADLNVNGVDLKETFNSLFRQVLKSTPLYESPSVVEEIKTFLQSELKATQDYFASKRNQIITSNSTLIMDGTHYLITKTDFSSKIQEETMATSEPKIDEVIKEPQQDVGISNIKKTSETIAPPIVDGKKEERNEAPNYQQSSLENAYLNPSKPIINQAEVKQPQIISEPIKVRNENQNYGTGMFSAEEPQMIQEQTTISNFVDNETKLIDVVKKQLNDHIWQDIGTYASRTDKTIDFVSNEIVNEVTLVLQKYGIPNNTEMTMRIVSQMNGQVKELNNTLSENMIRTFDNINEETINSLSETFSKPKEIKEQDVEQCLEVYMQSTELKGFHLSCSRQFDSVTAQICSLYGISANTPQYREISRIVENKRVQVESQMHNMFNDFSNSNSMFMTNIIGATIMSQEFLHGSQEDYSIQQIQILLNYNKQEYEKSNYDQLMAQQIEQEQSGISR